MAVGYQDYYEALGVPRDALSVVLEVGEGALVAVLELLVAGFEILDRRGLLSFVTHG